MNKVKNNTICGKCALPANNENILLDTQGVCGICQQNQEKKDANPEYLETDLLKLLKQNKSKSNYDCMVMCSGGKDSTLALYYMVKKYKLKVLAYTFDHGFENKQALENIKNATDKLNVDWLYFKTNFMKDAFREIIVSRSKTTICHICALWYTQLCYNTAANYKIPILIAGWRKEQSSSGEKSFDEYEYLSVETKNFIKYKLRKMAKYKNFPLNFKEAKKDALKKQKIIAISPHWFLNDLPEDKLALLKKELNWKQIDQSYPLGSTNCQLNFPSVFLSMKNFGFSHYHIEVSKKIRNGEISREEALKSLKINFDKKYVNSILKKLDCKI
jgi:hypothetical protein